MTPSSSADGIQRGYIIPIGGAEDHEENPVILERFAHQCGGSQASIVIIPTASQLRDTGSRYIETFDELGVGQALSIPIQRRADGERADYLKKLEGATGIFLTGGNQLRLSTVLGGTPVAQMIRRMNARGVHVAGTSAGAAILPEHMIAGGKGGATPSPDSASTSAVSIFSRTTSRNRTKTSAGPSSRSMPRRVSGCTWLPARAPRATWPGR